MDKLSKIDSEIQKLENEMAANQIRLDALRYRRVKLIKSNWNPFNQLSAENAMHRLAKVDLRELGD